MIKAAYVEKTYVGEAAVCDIVPFISKPVCCRDGEFVFLNVADRFDGWNMTGHGMLWAYNLNYMDWLAQPAMSVAEGARWIDCFIDSIGENRVGLDPYPTALRGINWIKFITANRDSLEPTRVVRWNDSLYSQYDLLMRRLEYHLLGNHLLEDAFSLFIASCYFGDAPMRRTATRLLRRELDCQILDDGAHYEQSPMYHCILLDRLLDCINFGRGGDDFMKAAALRMLGHLESVMWSDGSIPLLNDSAEGIAPSSAEIFDYARRLGLAWQPAEMRGCGYRKLKNDVVEAIVDVGGIAATYQPGHSHADALNFELRVGGRPVVVDTGISTYEKNARRQNERSTAAHNTVTVDGKDSAEVWGGFRVGSRCSVKITRDEKNDISAWLSTGHDRSFGLSGNRLVITDAIGRGTKGVARFHLDPSVAVTSAGVDVVVTDRAVFRFDGASEVNVADCEVARQYNRLVPAKCIEVAFDRRLTTEIVGRL